MNLDRQLDYWNSVGATKRFSHPVDIARLRQWLPPAPRILDYGCGYGRVLGILQSNGFNDLVGVDAASSMVAAAQQAFPTIPIELLQDHTVNLPDESIDAALLFMVLTCVPSDDGQRAIISEMTRLLRPGGVLYISDMLLQQDDRNWDRYAAGQTKYDIYGVFDLPEGVTCRHHERAWIQSLTVDYEPLTFNEITVETMNGHPATAFQWFGRK